MKELLKNFMYFGFAVALEKAIAFLLIPLYANQLSVEEFGVIDLIQTLITIASIAVFLQLETAFQRYYYGLKSFKRKEFATTLILSVFVLSIIVLVGIALCSGMLSELLFGTDKYKSLLIVASAQLPLTALSVMAFILIRFEGLNKVFSAIIIIKTILLVGLMSFFLIYTQLNQLGYFIAQFMALFLSVLLLYFYAYRYLALSFNKKFLILSLRYSLPQLPARLGSLLNSYGNRFFMISYLSTIEIGLFSMALRFASVMYLFHQTFTMAWNQYIFKPSETANQKKNIINLTNILVPLLCIVIVIMTIFSKEIIRVVTTVEYLDSYKFIGISCLSAGLLSINEIFNVGPKLVSKTKYLSYSFIASLFINIALLAYLTPKLGLEGVVVATLTANTVLILFNYIFTKIVYPINFNILYIIFVLTPVYLLALLIVFTQQSLLIRLGLLILCLIIYAYYVVKYIKKIRV